jgi:uncharacterized protein YqfB (UPF0267 family)
MTGQYISATTVRRTIGLSVSQISDADIESFITEIEAEVPRFFNTSFTMREAIDIIDGDGSDRVMLKNNPVWAVRELISDTVTETPANLVVYREGGKVRLSTTSIVSRFPNKMNIIRARYLYGKLDYSTTSTKTTVASIAGTSITLNVSSSTSFTVNDWVDIKSMDGNYEAAQITSKATGTITVDQLVYAHSSGAIVTKLEVSQIFTRIMNVIASLSVIGRILGQSANTRTSYTVGELTINFQEPNVLWEKTFNQFVQERDELMKRIKIRPIAV